MRRHTLVSFLSLLLAAASVAGVALSGEARGAGRPLTAAPSPLATEGFKATEAAPALAFGPLATLAVAAPVSAASARPATPIRIFDGLGFGPATVLDFQHTEGEPLNYFDKDGNYWTTGPSFVHRSMDDGDQFNVVRPVPGSGDSAVSGDDQGNAYLAAVQAMADIDCSASTNGGNTWVDNPECAHRTGLDRPWLAVDNGSNHSLGTAGAADNTVFLVYHDLVNGHYIYSSPGSTGPADPVGGLVFQNSSDGPPTQSAVAIGSNCGPLVFDPISRNLYYPCTTAQYVAVAIGHVNPGQRTGIHYQLYTLPGSPGNAVSNLFPLLTIDAAGILYMVWSDVGDHNIYYSYFPDNQNWSPPVRLNSAPANTTAFAWATAGSAGNLAIVWLGNDSTQLSDNMPNWSSDPAAANNYPWYGYVALVKNANTATPTIDQSRFTEKPMHYGQICHGGLAGTGCLPTNDRTMLDFLSTSIDPYDGSIRIAYNDTTSQFHGAHVFEERQLTGPTPTGTTINKAAPTSVVSDPSGDAHFPHYAPVGPGSNQDQFDLSSVAFNEQSAGTLRVRMTVKDIAALNTTGKADGFWITRFQALSDADTAGASAYRIFYVGAECAAACATPTFFAGSPSSATGCTTPADCKLVQYPQEITSGLTGTVVGNTICIDLPLSVFGSGRSIAPDATLYNVSAFSGGRENSATDVYADVDSTRSFDFQLGTVSQSSCAAPTAVRVMGFGARAGHGGVVLRWRTASEAGVLGFNVWRRGAGGELRLNHALVSAGGRASGARYRLVDRNARPGASYTYRLQIVSRDGARSWYRSARVRVAR
jgi:hypothetical protein